MLVHTPAHLADREKNAGLVYAHGGAVLSGSAHLYKPHLSLLAINCGIPVFNVDYRQHPATKRESFWPSRLAPESKCPQQAIDFSSVLTHLSSNACSFGLDPQRLAAAGESGGGWVVDHTIGSQLDANYHTFDWNWMPMIILWITIGCHCQWWWEQVCLHVCPPALGNARSNRTGENDAPDDRNLQTCHVLNL